MSKRFLIEGETDKKVLVGVAFNEQDVAIELNIYSFDPKLKESLLVWVKGGEMPTPEEKILRTVADEHLLPEEIKVKNVGKVRQIEIEWGNMLIQTRLLQSFDSELLILKERVAGLNQFEQEVYDDCSNFWSRLLDFKKDHNIANDKLDAYKLELDVLFEALKALRKDSRKEFDETSLVHFEALNQQLDKVASDLGDKPNFKSIANQLKKIRGEFNKTAMRKSHKEAIDQRINGFFDQLSEERKKQKLGNVDKRISDLEAIMAKMQKGIDWEKRQLAKHQKDKEYANLQFQVKLLDTKIAMIENNLAEREAKLKNITATYNQLKKEA